MNHFYENIHGWFSFDTLYTNAVQRFNDAKFVEVGCWKGRSTAFLAVEIVNSNKNIELYCVDTWLGSAEHTSVQEVVDNTLYETFLNNMKTVKDVIKPMRMTSLQAAQQFEDGTLDFVFIDASHDYENVKADIQAWYPKVKTGGVFAGHDYKDNWPGVDQAVDEFFTVKNLSVDACDGFCWRILKP